MSIAEELEIQFLGFFALWVHLYDARCAADWSVCVGQIQSTNAVLELTTSCISSCFHSEQQTCCWYVWGDHPYWAVRHLGNHHSCERRISKVQAVMTCLRSYVQFHRKNQTFWQSNRQGTPCPEPLYADGAVIPNGKTLQRIPKRMLLPFANITAKTSSSLSKTMKYVHKTPRCIRKTDIYPVRNYKTIQCIQIYLYTQDGFWMNYELTMTNSSSKIQAN